MLFLQPLALLLLATASVPPLLHLFQRRRPPDALFPAVRYLRQTEQEASRTIRLRHLLLLLLRVAAVVLVAFAAARPVIPARVGAGHAPTALVIVLDNSLSSGAVAGGARVFDDLAARARETLRAAQGGDALWLITADLLARRGTPADLLAAVDATRPDARRLDLAAAVGVAAGLIRASGYARGEIHVLTDLQQTALGGPGPGDSVAAALPLLFYHPAAAPPANRGVVLARAVPATWVSAAAGGGGSAVTVGVGGGPAPSAGARAAVTVTVGGRTAGRSLAAPGETVSLPAAAPAAGWAAGTAGLEPDELRADDARPFAVRVVAPARIAVQPGADLGRFVTVALGALARAGQVAPGAAAADVVLGERAPPVLGGRSGAVVFPPHDPVDLGAANRALAAAGFPWRFGAVVTREDTLAAPRVSALAGARVLARYRLERAPAAGAEPAGEVLARAGGDPWLVRHGRLLVVASRLVPEQTGLPLGGAFVPFLGDLVNRLARGEEGIVEAAPGETVTVPSAVTALGLGADSLLPVTGAAADLAGGRGVAAPAVPGVYPLLAGADTLGALVVAPDPRESDLTRATDADVTARFPGADVTVASGARAYAAARFRGAGRSELTGPLLLLALLVLVVESLVAAGALGRRAAGSEAA